MLALRAEAHLDVRFVHGVPSASVREGQAAAALADVLVRGLSQDGIRRLAALLRQGPGPFREHAVGEIDRLMARPEEFRVTAQAPAAASCWRAWAGAGLTGHDGRIRPNHLVVLSVLRRVHSARSLRKLLRDPLGFVWRYGLGLETADPSEETLTLDHRAFGSLMHEVLEATAGALAAAVVSVAAAWERERPVLPALVWRRTLDEVTAISLAALSHPDAAYAGQTTWVEVPFGRQAPKRAGAAVPWGHGLPV